VWIGYGAKDSRFFKNGCESAPNYYWLPLVDSVESLCDRLTIPAPRPGEKTRSGSAISLDILRRNRQVGHVVHSQASKARGREARTEGTGGRAQR
jgi:hypothetical protein